MSAGDMAIVRTHDKGYNLAVGEPFFLREELSPILYPLSPKFQNIMYPQFRGEPRLLEELGYMYPGKHVVVTNGAKQALLAACYALREENPKRKWMHHKAPYWVTYPTIAHLSNLRFRDIDITPDDNRVIEVTTSPNNPDGSLETEDRHWDIWDAAYASPVYGWDGIVPYHKISVWSASKLYGVSGYRVGWLVTGDQHLADLAAMYVEKTTSGVATTSQDLMAYILENEGYLDLKHNAANSRRKLFQNSMALSQVGDLFEKVDGFPSNGRGMFAWVKANEPERFEALLNKAQVKVVDGVHCGAEKGWYRISLGQTTQVMEEAIGALQKAKENG